MPAESIAQRRLAAIAKYHPEQVYARNRSILSMKKKELHKYASTKETGLPQRVKARSSAIKKLKKRTHK